MKYTLIIEMDLLLCYYKNSWREKMAKENEKLADSNVKLAQKNELLKTAIK